eukprot:scaffold9289_cov39-Phaeocystis_antarctica.AAC.1
MVRLQEAQMRAAPFLDLHYPSLWCRLAPRRKLLVLTPMLAHALSSRSWSRVVLEREGRKDAVRSEPSIVFGVPAGYAGGWYGCIHVSHCGCVHVGHGQQKVRCKYGWDGHVTSARRESDCLDCLCKGLLSVPYDSGAWDVVLAPRDAVHDAPACSPELISWPARSSSLPRDRIAQNCTVRLAANSPSIRTSSDSAAWNGGAERTARIPQARRLLCSSTAYAAVARDTTAATDSWRRRRHRRSGIVDFGIDRLEGAAPTKQERARRTRRLCAGVRGIEVLSARRSGCEARTAHRARPTRRAAQAAQRPAKRHWTGELRGCRSGNFRREEARWWAELRRTE